MRNRLSMGFLLTIYLIICSSLISCSTGNQRLTSKNESAKQSEVKFPKGDISILIPAAAGGGNDLTVRALIPGLKDALEENIFPINEPAGKGRVAFNEVAGAKPDGHKLYFNSKTLLLMKYFGIKEAKPEKLVPVAQVAEDVAIFYVRADSQWETIMDLINHLKTSAEMVKTANTGLGGVWHLPQILFNKAIGVDNMEYYTYPSGSTAMLNALVSGEVDLVVCGPEGRFFIDSGKVKPLAVIYPTRYPSFPDVPTMKEAAGLDIEYKVWRGVFTTAGTDEAIIQILSEACKKAVESEEFKEYAATGMIPLYKDYREFSKIVKREQKELDMIMPEIMMQIDHEAKQNNKIRAKVMDISSSP